jgi:Mrp family chromosome partitioning ATPase
VDLADLPGDYVVSKPASAFAESIRNVRATLLAGGDGPRPQTICVTSALTGEGKSVISPWRLPGHGDERRPVLLIDCDLRA